MSQRIYHCIGEDRSNVILWQTSDEDAQVIRLHGVLYVPSTSTRPECRGEQNDTTRFTNIELVVEWMVCAVWIFSDHRELSQRS